MGSADFRTCWAKRNSDSEKIEQTWTIGSIAKHFSRGGNPREIPSGASFNKKRTLTKVLFFSLFKSEAVINYSSTSFNETSTFSVFALL